MSFAFCCFPIRLDSVICGKIEKTASITATFIIKTRTPNEIHAVKVPECSNNMCIVCVKKRVFSNVAVIVKRAAGSFFRCLALNRRSEVLGTTHKVFHNASGALYTGKLTSRNIA